MLKEKKIVFPEGEDERILKASAIIVKKKIAKVILLGDIKKILEKFEKLKLRFNVSIINPETAIEKEIYIQKLYELRRRKGLSIKEARKLILDRNYFACMMLHEGKCDAVLSGAVFSTPEILIPAFRIIKTKKNVKKASGAVLMKIKNKYYLFADVSVQERPTATELAEIAILSARTFEKMVGKRARVAMLSYHTYSKRKDNITFFNDVRKATNIARKKGLNVIGEVQLDAALNKETALRKHIPFIDANVLIFPNLDAGNIGYKIAKIFSNAEMTGVIIQGLKKPVNDLSRGCDIKDIVRLAIATIKQ
ncbi:MAG: phosphate acyltransferase [Candidatus Pacearchaeota archaeon]